MPYIDLVTTTFYQLNNMKSKLSFYNVGNCGCVFQTKGDGFKSGVKLLTAIETVEAQVAVGHNSFYAGVIATFKAAAP